MKNASKLYSFLVLITILLFVFACGKGDENYDQTSGLELSVDPAKWINQIGNDFLIDDQHSYIGFKIKYFGFSPVRGRFDKFDGTVFYDPDNPGLLSVSLIIDVTSINTGVKMRDNDLQTQGPGWFNIRDYPRISFNSSQVSINADSTFNLTGILTMNGITKQITAVFSPPTPLSRDLWANDQVDFSGKLRLDRMDFEVTGGSFWSDVMENGITQLSHEVEIELDIHTRRTDYLLRMASEDTANIRVSIPKLVQAEGIQTAINELRRLQNLAETSVTSGALSTIGYTLLAQDKLKEALAVFQLRKEFYPDRLTTDTQIGIVQLKKGELSKARKSFMLAASKDSSASRPLEYLRVMDKIDR